MSNLLWVFVPKREAVRSLISDYIHAQLRRRQPNITTHSFHAEVRVWHQQYRSLQIKALYKEIAGEDLPKAKRVCTRRGKRQYQTQEWKAKVRANLPVPMFTSRRPWGMASHFALSENIRLWIKTTDININMHAGTYIKKMTAICKDADMAKTIGQIEPDIVRTQSPIYGLQFTSGEAPDINKTPLFPILVSNEYARRWGLV